MVNYSIKIIKTNNHVSSQQTEHNNGPRPRTLEIQFLAWDSHTNVAELNRLLESQTSPMELHTNENSTILSYSWKRIKEMGHNFYCSW